MKTILKIITILLIAGIVAGAFVLAVNNSSSASSSNVTAQPPAMTASSGQSAIQLMARPAGGDRESGSITQGLAGIAGTLMKLTGISIVVLLVQKGFSTLGNRKLMTIQR